MRERVKQILWSWGKLWSHVAGSILSVENFQVINYTPERHSKAGIKAADNTFIVWATYGPASWNEQDMHRGAVKPWSDPNTRGDMQDTFAP